MSAAQRPVAIVTGSSRGIGKEVARSLRTRGFHVILACRSSAKATEVLQELDEELDEGAGCGSAQFMALDLSVFASVHTFSAAFLALRLPLQALICNAGINGASSTGEPTADGFDDVFATNYLGHYLLCRLLAPALAKSNGRVLMVSSVLHRSVSDPQSYFCDEEVRGHRGGLYGLSKLAQILHAQELARRLPNVVALCVNPGGVGSEIWRDYPWWQRWAIQKVTGTPERAGNAIAEAVLSDDFAPRPSAFYLSTQGRLPASWGEYWDPSAGDEYVEVEPSALALDADLAKQLWEDSSRWVGLPSE